jgi:hypothetical protein
MIHIERIILPSCSGQIFSFGFRDAESFKFFFNFFWYIFPVGCVSYIVLVGLGVVDDIVEIEFRKIGTSFRA